MMKHQENAITLIALIITIILLLILAGVTLSIVFNGGIIDKSQSAVDQYARAQAKEKLQLAITEYRMLPYTGDGKTFEEVIEDIGGKVNHDTENGKYDVTIDGFDFLVNDETFEIKDIENGSGSGNESGEGGIGTPGETNPPGERTKYTVTIEKDDEIASLNVGSEILVEEGKSIEITAIPISGFVFSKWKKVSGEGTIENENSATTKIIPKSDMTIKASSKINLNFIVDNIEGEQNKTLTGKTPSYENPVIPVGFGAINADGVEWNSTDGSTVEDWNDGLVIADRIGNEFVWVPAQLKNGDIPNVTEYKTWYVYGEDNSELPSGIASEETQIGTYGGFYIARYEAGTKLEFIERPFAEDVKPLSKKGEMPWNFIHSSYAMEVAQIMHSTHYVQSGLITETMWDTVLKWMENSGIITEDEIYLGVSWGNYVDTKITGIEGFFTDFQMTQWKETDTKNEGEAGILLTGASSDTKRKNIYDLAGNMKELTSNTQDFDHMYTSRGGACYMDKMYGAISSLQIVGTTEYDTSFRVCLFIK